MRTTPEEFVRIWQAASSQMEVAEKLGLSQAAVCYRAKKYRTLGVRLKHYPKLPKIDVDALNAIIDNGREPNPKKRARSTD